MRGARFAKQGRDYSAYKTRATFKAALTSFDVDLMPS
jgi:hypothetical protein